MTSWTIAPVPTDAIPETEYGNEDFIEIHLDERYDIGENMQLWKIWKKNDIDAIILEKNYRIFHSADQCIDFITSYEWRKVFLTLTDHFSYLIELIHHLPQIVYFYIYSRSPERISYTTVRYPKLRAIVQEDSPNADEQLLKDIDIFRQDFMPMNVVKPIKRKTKLLIQEPISLDTYRIIWLVDKENLTTIDTSPISNINIPLKIFYSLDQSIDVIKSSTDTKFFFISSHSNNQMVVEKVAEYSQVIAIYIVQTEADLTRRSQFSHSKLHGIYSDIPCLAEELSKEYKHHLNYSEMPLSVFHRDKNEKTVRDLNKNNVKFLWFQLLIDILIQIPHNDYAKDEMLDECRKHFGIPDNNDNDEKIDENMIDAEIKKDRAKAEKDLINFEKNYKSSEALKFYTNDSFLYRLFNRAFRTENIDLLFIFRFFLADMYKHLQKLHSEQFPDKLPRTMFRGQVMTSSEFNSIKNNIGHLISVNTFFSTTTTRDVAEMYSGLGEDTKMLSVLFEIEVDTTRSMIKRPFASINELSQFSDEDEVVFSVGSMFRIKYVENQRSVNGYWYVQLELVEDDNEMNELRNDLEQQYCDKGNLRSLGLVLRAMGDYERAERYFRMLLEYIPEGHYNMGFIYSDLAMIALDKGDYQTAIQHDEKALKYFTAPDIYDQREYIGHVYTQLGTAHQHLGNLDLAMKYLTMATDIQKSPESLSCTYNQMALVYRDKGEKQLALEYFQKTLNIEEQVLKRNKYEPVLATMYNNIGEIYVQLGDDENALKYLHHALYIRLKGTVSTHTDLAAIYTNLGNVYSRRQELKKALEVLEKALEIDTQKFGSNHESLAVTHNNMSLVYKEMNDLPRAVHHLETALKILLRSQAGENHVNISELQLNLGMVQFALGNSNKALRITQKALQNQLKKLPENHEMFANTYLLLAKIYKNEKDMINALKFMEKVIEVARVAILPKDKLAFESFQLQIDLLKNSQYGEGLGFQQADGTISYMPDNSDQQDDLISNCHQQLQQVASVDIINRLQLLNNNGALYSKKENFPMAIKYFNEAIDIFNKNQTSDQYFPEQLENIIKRSYFGISRVYYRQEDWAMSLKNLQKALDFALKQNQDYFFIAEIYHAMGLSYKHQLDFYRAIHYLELAISTAKKELPNDHPRIQIYVHNLRQLKN
ncbi:unnamed protein product [Rotaria sordida]|uniref:NAD(P)(+)--arginine ADP-ribosyltransferase n=2 Tax=Rotaria sordida TaxID=392033 RepID=A0A815ZVN6_9BILA|nr:unnamed protein product [Rotaria sordida]CAF1587132.1 unnamed protein product [Rotaria sordida]